MKLEKQTIYECDICHDLERADADCSDDKLPPNWNEWRNLTVCPKCSKAVGVTLVLLIGGQKSDE